MKKNLLLTAIILVTIISFSCKDLLIDSDPVGRTNPEDPETTAEITGDSEINIHINNSDFLTGDTYEFMTDTGVGGSQSTTFTIENLSSDTDLELSGTPLVSITGSDDDQFSITQMPDSTIAPGEDTAFILTFSPSNIGDMVVTLRIENNDPTEDSYEIEIMAVAVESEVIPIPQNPQVVAGDEELTISWDPVTGVDSYTIYWDGTPGITTDDYWMRGLTSTSFTHTSLDNGTTYYYVVTATIGGVESDISTEASGTPVAPATIGEISVTQGGGEIISTGFYTFADTAVGGNTDVEFVINNTSPD